MNDVVFNRAIEIVTEQARITVKTQVATPEVLIEEMIKLDTVLRNRIERHSKEMPAQRMKMLAALLITAIYAEVERNTLERVSRNA